jgi:ATP-dependent RNA helicase RhlE
VTQFQDLGLAAPILKALAAEGYATPTPIQSQAIPLLLAGKDLIGLAQTGTGKTAAFALPILHRLADDRRHAGPRSCRVLVLAPTRELAAQIGDSFRAYGRFLGFSTTVVFGGASMFRQKEIMARGVDVLVATPGRLIDHIGERSINLDKVEMLVLDEADHMMDIGFIQPLRRIAKLVPAQRQTIFFSARPPFAPSPKRWCPEVGIPDMSRASSAPNLSATMAGESNGKIILQRCERISMCGFSRA